MARKPYTGYSGTGDNRRKAEQTARETLKKHPQAEGCTIGFYTFDRGADGQPVLVGYDALGSGSYREDFHADV